MNPTIQSAGRVLSQKNTERMKSLFKEVGSILVDSKVTSLDDLRGFLGDIEKIGERLEERIEDLGGEANPDEIAAGKVGETLRSNAWQSSMSSAMETFRSRFMGLFRMTEGQIERYYGSEKDRGAIAQEILNDFNDFLGKQIDDFPGFDEALLMSPPCYPGMYDPMYASAKETTEPATEPATEEIVQAQGQPEELELEFTCQVHEIEAAAVVKSPRSMPNCLPIEGVLFIIDEPSECAPSKGSDLPLYVPRHVAEVAAEAINAAGGLPLDADDSLSCHANNHIVGIMTSAQIDGNQFLVKGHLFPWSQGEKVQLITANQNILGMSMNAQAMTRPAIVGGARVSHIDSLEILGANILYADRATYQKTQTRIAASRQVKEEVETETTPDSSLEVAASSTFIQELTMDPAQIEKYFQQMNGTLSGLADDNKRYIKGQEELQAQVVELATAVGEIQAERREVQAQRQTAQTEEQRKQERSELVQAMAEVIKSDRSTLKDEILDAINPKRQPARITRNLVDLVASGGEGDTQAQAMAGDQVRYIQAQGELQAYRKSSVPGAMRTKLVEEISGIEGRNPGIKEWYIACSSSAS
jgi:hypothetical protein